LFVVFTVIALLQDQIMGAVSALVSTVQWLMHFNNDAFHIKLNLMHVIIL
jgi:hypothetical protein